MTRRAPNEELADLANPRRRKRGEQAQRKSASMPVASSLSDRVQQEIRHEAELASSSGPVVPHYLLGRGRPVQPARQESAK